METTISEERFSLLFLLLIRLMEGDFSTLIPIEGKGDKFEVVENYCNKLAQQLGQIFKHTAFIKPKSSREFLLQFSFDLDESFTIVNTSRNTRKLLKVKAKDLHGRSFKEVLNKESQLKWEKFQKRLPSTDRNIIKLLLPDREGREISAYCQVSEIDFLEGYKYRVTSSVSVLYEEFVFHCEEEMKAKAYNKKKAHKPPSVMDRPEDLRVVFKLRDFLIDNAEASIPLVEDLAQQFGTNGTKLRSDFKQYFEMTPSQFHHKLRFQAAKHLIENTSLPLTQIADDIGFRRYTSFSTAFTKRFGYTPRVARKRARSLDD